MSWLARLLATRPPGRCGLCQHFNADPHAIEAMIPGLRSLGSAFASTRGGDGLCGRHDLYLPPDGGCGEFAAREGGRR